MNDGSFVICILSCRIYYYLKKVYSGKSYICHFSTYIACNFYFEQLWSDFFFFCLNVPSENTYVNFQKSVFQGKIREKK